MGDAELTFRNDLKPTWCARQVRQQGTNGENAQYFCDDLASLFEVRTAAEIAAREEVLDETGADVITHLLELFVHLGVVLVVLYELHDKCAG